MAGTLPLPDTTPYGIVFAERVAARLMDGASVYYKHRDYCGMGLWYADGCFCYDEIHDCGPDSVERIEPTIGQRGGFIFRTRHEFVEWLAFQSDHTLAGFEKADPWWHQNQRITRERLEQELGCY